MRKMDNPANCVGVVTVKWSVQNDDVKAVYSNTFGFRACWLNKDAVKKLKEAIQTKIRILVEGDKTYFGITESSIVRYSSSVKMIGCDFVLENESNT
ncbi:MAG: hypothetical protein HXK22_00490 [Alloprevotella tannerae]|jgi:hypothetical protein|nr:hypothetical protein [Alloprevotella tannerae]DAN56270.1 MAG TPA: hypothetical protein [Caudoviricetes sp.]